MNRSEALQRAIDAVGLAGLAAPCGVSRQAVSQWRACPPMRVLAVEAASGVPRHELRPDLYPSPASAQEYFQGTAS